MYLSLRSNVLGHRMLSLSDWASPASPPEFQMLQIWVGRRICLSNKFPGTAGALGAALRNCGLRHLALEGSGWAYFRIIWMIKIV